jgi:hypothetical protein
MVEQTKLKHRPDQASREGGPERFSMTVAFKLSVILSHSRWRSHRWQTVTLSERSGVEGLSKDQLPAISEF